MALSTLACTLFGTDSTPAPDRIVILTRLPTFTRTPLPTLTPTAPSGQPIEATATPFTANSPTSMPPPTIDEISTASPTLAAIGTPPTAVALINPISTPTNTVSTSPTFTPANTPTAMATPSPTMTPNPTATPTDTPTPQPSATPTFTPTTQPISNSPGWSFTNLRIYPDQPDNSLLLYGDLINDTGSPQELEFITGIFYDAQGQVIADDDNTGDYWPLIATIPPGGRVPFELRVDGIQNAANFNLTAEAHPSSEVPHQEFEFSEVNQWNEGGAYCVKARLQNLRDRLEDYLVIAVILYDGQGNVVNFADYEPPEPEELEHNQTLAVEICVASLNQEVARYELQAWGL